MRRQGLAIASNTTAPMRTKVKLRCGQRVHRRVGGRGANPASPGEPLDATALIPHLVEDLPDCLAGYRH